MRHAPRIAAFACASLALGGAIAVAVPTEPKVARASGLERLSQPQIVSYPGADRMVSGSDTYPVIHSRQWLAVAAQAERARIAKWALPEVEPIGYDQPASERDAAIEVEGAGDVSIHRGSNNPAEAEPSAQIDAGDQPEG